MILTALLYFCSQKASENTELLFSIGHLEFTEGCLEFKNVENPRFKLPREGICQFCWAAVGHVVLLQKACFLNQKQNSCVHIVQQGD